MGEWALLKQKALPWSFRPPVLYIFVFYYLSRLIRFFCICFLLEVLDRGISYYHPLLECLVMFIPALSSDM